MYLHLQQHLHGSHLSKGVGITGCVTGTSVSPEVSSDQSNRERCGQPDSQLCCGRHQQLVEGLQGGDGGVGITVQQAAHCERIHLESNENTCSSSPWQQSDRLRYRLDAMFLHRVSTTIISLCVVIQIPPVSAYPGVV